MYAFFIGQMFLENQAWDNYEGPEQNKKRPYGLRLITIMLNTLALAEAPFGMPEKSHNTFQL